MRTAHPLRGVALFVLCLFLFACLDTTTKYLAQSHPAPLIVATRYAVNLLLMVAILAPRHSQQMLAINRKGWVIVRALSLSIGSITMALALQRMPVAETSAILFFAPVVVTLAAAPVLGERVSPASYVAAALGLAGVMLIVRPGSGLDPLGVVLAALAMLANVIYQLLSRVLGASERTISLLFYTTLTGTIIFGAIAPWFWTGHVPTGHELLLFLSLGVYGGLGHFLYTAAFRDTPASILAPLNYVQLVFVGFLGWAVFAHVPDTLSLTGMAIIAGAGTLAALRTRAPTIKRSV